jgi:hypothetical protein
LDVTANRPQPLDEILRTLEEERLAADRAYNAALTELGRVQLRSVSTLPLLPLGDDRHAAATRELIEIKRRQNQEIVDFQHRLILLLLEITGVVEARDREHGGLQTHDEIRRARQQLAELEREIRSAAAAGTSPSAPVEPETEPDTPRTFAVIESLSAASGGSVPSLRVSRVLEYLAPVELIHFLDLAFQKLAPGAEIVLETINAASWMAFFESYNLDVTRVRPIHPETLEHLVKRAGFHNVEIKIDPTAAEASRLPAVHHPARLDAELQPIAEAINAHADRLNAQLFSSWTYQVRALR